MNYLVYGQIEDIQGSVLHLSTGHRIRINASDIVNSEGQVVLSRGDTHFIRVNNRRRTLTGFTYQFVSSRRVNDSDIPQIDVLSRNLAQQGRKCVDTLEKLNAVDACAVLKVAGIGISGAVTLSNVAATAYETLELLEGGPFNPMTWVTHAGVAVGGAVYTALLYDRLRADLKRRTDVVRIYQKAHAQYSQLMLKYMPINGVHAEPLNCEVQELMSVLRPVFNSTRAKMGKFWHNKLGVNPSFAPQPA
jgi:hypothetical protein